MTSLTTYSHQAVHPALTRISHCNCCLNAATVLTVFCLGNGLNEMMQLTFTPTAASTARAFGVSEFAASLLPTVYLVVFAPAALVLALARGRLGLRGAIVAGCTVQMVGAWVRYAACALPTADGIETPPHPYFAALLVGQALAALAQPVFTNLPAVLATVWFSAAARPLATILGTLCNPIGNAIGSIVPGLVVADDASPAEARSGLAWLTLGQALVASAITIAAAVLVEDAPRVPPSAAAALRRSAMLGVEQGVGRAAKTLSAGRSGADVNVSADSTLESRPIIGNDDGTNPLLNYGDIPSGSDHPAVAPSITRAAAALFHDVRALFGVDAGGAAFGRLVLGFGLGLGVFNALLGQMGQLLSPCGYGAGVAGLAGGVMLLAGTLGAVAAGAALSRATPSAHVYLLRGGISVALTALLGFLAALQPGRTGLLYVAAAVLASLLCRCSQSPLTLRQPRPSQCQRTPPPGC